MQNSKVTVMQSILNPNRVSTVVLRDIVERYFMCSRILLLAFICSNRFPQKSIDTCVKAIKEKCGENP